MKSNLSLQAWSKLLLGVGIVALLLFGPAGTLHYPNAWLLIGLLFIPMTIAGVIMLRKNPDLLKKRLDAREKEPAQKKVILLSLLMFVGGFVLAALDFRFGWSRLPRWLSHAAGILFLLGYAMYGEVLRENTWLSRAIRVHQNQTVVDSGLYGVIRHPMYTASILMFLSMPLILGSLYACVLFLIYPLLILARVRNEEAVLLRELPGYDAYTKKVKYRLIPFIY